MYDDNQNTNPKTIRPTSHPARGFKDGKLYVVMHPNETTAQLLPDIPACATYIKIHGEHLLVRAEHLQGQLIWRGDRTKRAARWSLDQLIAHMQASTNMAENAGYGRLTPDERNRINDQQRITYK